MNRTPKIIPPINKSLIHPIIGSGKISRRIIAKPFANYKKKESRLKNNKFSQMLQNRISHLEDKIANTEKKRAIPWQTASAKIIFYYWNGLGHPFVHHRPELNKTTSLAIHKINKHLPKYGKEKIIYAIKTAHEIFSASWFKYRYYFSVKKINLPNFFEYDKTSFRKESTNHNLIPHSWFKECLKGERYLEQKYSIKIKDSNPQITKQLLIVWQVYNKYDRLSVKDNNNLIRCSHLLKIFAEKNNIDPLSLVDIISHSLNKWKTYQPKHSGYLTNNIFWQEQLPQELIRYGLFRSLREIKL